MKSKILKFSLALICIILIVCGVVLFILNKGVPDIINVGDNKNNNEDNNPYDNIEIAYYEGEEQYSWAVDPTIPNNLIQENTVVVKFKTVAMDKARFLPSYPKFYTYKPYTPIEIEILESLFGAELLGEFTIYKKGGIVTVRDMVENLPTMMMEKRGFTNLSIEEQESTYAKYTDEYDYELKVGGEYVCIIYKQECEDNIYTLENGYYIFKEDNAIYKNVLTGNVLNITK